MDLTPTEWNTRYINTYTGWDLGFVSNTLKFFFDGLKDSSIQILIPGGGNGYEAEYLWNKGFHNVFLLDWAEQSLQNFAKRVPQFPASQLLEKDFFEHSGQYDLIIEQTFFCAIDPALRPQYAKQVFELLKPGGRLVGLLFDREFDLPGPPFGGSRNEYLEYFSPLFKIHKLESCYNSIPARAGRELFINFIKS